MLSRWALSIILTLICSTAFAQDYEIRLNRPDKVGDRYLLSGLTTERYELKVTQGFNVLQEKKSSFSGKLEATVTVLETDDKKDGDKLKLAVSMCRTSENGFPEKESLPLGTVVVVRHQKGETVFYVDGKPVAPEVKKMLDVFISAHDVKTTDDDVFGTNERKKVGDRWGIHQTAMAKGLAEYGIITKADSIKGSTTLDKVVEIDGIKALHLTGNAEITDLTSTETPPGLSVDKANAFFFYTGDFPIDSSMALLSDRLDMTLTLSGRMTPSPNVMQLMVSMRMEQNVEKKFKPLNGHQ